MEQRSGQKRAGDSLYPPIEPFDRRILDVGDGHTLYVEQCGNPHGAPVIVLHGGPGGGCSPIMRRFFDPAHYRVILFDQRGCGRSQPRASVVANTTWHLVADIERIREDLGLEKALIFGGSWGATLALIYAITHPERVAGLALRGVFLGSTAELEWFYGGGAGRFYPLHWAHFANAVPEEERGDLIGAYHRRLFPIDGRGEHPDAARLARIWTGWENALASAHHDGPVSEAPQDYARVFARLENHYFQNRCFLDRDGWILHHRARIEHIPAIIVQGRMDMICPPVSATRLAEGWGAAHVRIVPLAGHALSEPGIGSTLVRSLDFWRDTGKFV